MNLVNEKNSNYSTETKSKVNLHEILIFLDLNI